MSAPTPAPGGHALPGPTPAPARDNSWWWVIGGFVLAVVIGILLATLKSQNWSGILNLLVGSFALYFAISLIFSAKSGEEEFGGGHMFFALVLVVIGVIMILSSVLPPSWLKSYQQGVSLYASQAQPKPHLGEVKAPEPVPDIAWVNVELPTGSNGQTMPPDTKVFVQLETTYKDAKVGLPVRKALLDARGKIVGWYGEGPQESKTDDL